MLSVLNKDLLRLHNVVLSFIMKFTAVLWIYFEQFWSDNIFFCKPTKMICYVVVFKPFTLINLVYYMTDSRDGGVNQSAFENPGPYIPIQTAPYGLPHTDFLIWTDISSHYDPNVFIENKAVKKGVKCNLMKLLSMKM